MARSKQFSNRVMRLQNASEGGECVRTESQEAATMWWKRLIFGMA